MKIKSVNLETVCGITSVLPENDKVEIAFAGRSNVGKSSLINALMNRKAYARTSSQPGKTQTINFYNINEALYFVDLPGYGFAKVSKDTVAKWGKMIEKYLCTSTQLKAVYLLVDSRHAPSANDKLMYDWVLSVGFRPVIIATKADKLKKNERVKNVNIIRKELGMKAEDKLILTSSLKKEAIDQVWKSLCDDAGIENIE